MSDVLVLGPQFRSPNLRDALARAGLSGQIVTITAGWQEREGELGALEGHLDQPVRDLRLYERAEAVFNQDAELHETHRMRQADLRRLQELYRARLSHAKTAEHLKAIGRIHARWDARLGVRTRPMLARQLAELEHLIDKAGIVCLAGGHVAVLLNRLRLFGLERLLRSRPVVAWSAGAMAISERIVLFHDHPPQGAGNAEIFEAGLGLVRDTVFLPHAASRLALGDRDRVSLLARRLSPAACVTLDDGSLLHWHRSRLVACANSSRLKSTGRTAALETTC
jgi:hypothetical protein